MDRMKYAFVALVILWMYLAIDTATGLAMSFVNEDYKPCKLGKEVSEPEVTCYKMQATAYCLSGRTASGDYTRKGIVASKPEWIGKIMAVYLENEEGKAGEFLGYYEVKDTGGKHIRTGKVLDIWMPTYNECIQFGRKNVVVFLIDGEADDEATKETNTRTETSLI